MKPLQPNPRQDCFVVGFTLIELLVVIAVVDANNNDGRLGLVGKRFDQVRKPSKTFLVEDNTFAAFFGNLNPFEISYWHDKKRLGYGGAAFVDGHVVYLHVARNQPDFQRGDGWTFVYNDP